MVDIAFDSSILIGFSHFDMEHIKYARKIEERPFFEVRDMIVNGEINAIITPTVYQEIKRGKHLDKDRTRKFINTYCEVLHPNQYCKDKALCVTDAYGNYLIDERTAIYHAEDYTQDNYDDATIVAEVSVEQKSRKKRIPFITANSRDVKDIERINTVNRRHGLPEIFICPLSKYMDAISFAKREDKEHTMEI